MVITGTGGKRVKMTASYRWHIAFALALPAAATAAEWEIEPRVSVGASWTDNITLADSGQDESDWVTALRPGIALSLAGPRVTGELA